MYGKELAGIDGSKFKAVNAKDRNFTKDKLKDRIERIDKTIDEYLKEIEETDRNEEAKEGTGKSAGEINKIIQDLKERKQSYSGYAAELEETGETHRTEGSHALYSNLC